MYIHVYEYVKVFSPARKRQKLSYRLSSPENSVTPLHYTEATDNMASGEKTAGMRHIQMLFWLLDVSHTHRANDN